MRDGLLEDAERAVRIAREVGADDAFAGLSWGRGVHFQWRQGRPERVQESVTKSLGIAVYVDGRYSSHATNDLDPVRLRGFISEAVALTRTLEPDPFRRITDPALYAGRAEKDLELVDGDVIAVTREDRVDWCRRAEGEALADDSVVSATTTARDAHVVSAFASTNGFAGTHERTSIALGADVALADGDARPEASRWVGGVFRSGVPAPEEVGREALARARARRGAKKEKSVRATMVVEREAAASLVRRLLGALSAGAVYQGRSFASELRGSAIASPLLSLSDEPHLARLGGSRLFDGEGIAARPLAIVTEGVLEAFYVDTYYGRKLGWEPTTGSSSNISLRLGDRGQAGLIADARSGILVTSWLGGNADMTSGDFSLGIRGHRIIAGEVGPAVSEMNVTGNLLDLFKRLSAVGDDPEPWASTRTPTLVFDDVQFSGL